MTDNAEKQKIKVKEKSMMKKWGITIIVFLCCILSAVNIWADDGQGQSPDYVTDYYMIVQSPNGGINLYSDSVQT